jgi:S-adenosyl-L-methionine hydrolase (adenosine-forming)
MSVITLTTDFGLDDWFVGAMKGVILGLAPRVTIVDITHAIPPGDIRAGAFTLLQAARCQPPGAIHVAVVDPGVGSERRAIGIQTRNAVFLGPDNGLLSLAVRGESIRSVRQLAQPRLFRQSVSRTFHGRDVFAPVAAHLARGVPFSRVGPPVPDYVRLRWPEPELDGSILHGQVVHIDRFGNAITNLDAARVTIFDKENRGSAIWIRPRRAVPLVECYAAVQPGEPLAVAGSCGWIEIAINGGSAARELGLKVGDPVRVGGRRVGRGKGADG